MHKIGIDLGGTKIEIVVLDGQHQEIFRNRIPTEQEKGYAAILGRVDSLYREAAGFIHYQPHALGIGIPGTISAKTNLVKNANTQCMIGKPFRQDIETKLNHRVGIENDANCFVMAEALLGAGVGKNVVFGVIMGTGCGGGIVINGKVHGGLQGIAGEWGHMQIDPAGPRCYCGKTGCTETFISGGGVQALYEKQFGEKKIVQEITEAYRTGEPGVTEIFQGFLAHFGVALSNVIDILDPDLVILGGGLSNIEELYTLGREEVRKRLFSDEMDTPIVKNLLGDSAGVFGAAMIGEI
jgi:fructokinase